MAGCLEIIFPDPGLLEVVFEQPEIIVEFPGEALPDGTAVPSGGSAGQLLRKTSGVDYATEWADPSSSAIQAVVLPASGSIGGHRAVSVGFDFIAGYADKDSAPLVFGVSTGAVNDGDNVTIQISGEMTESSWSWVPGVPLFLGSSGLITQTPPETGHLVVIGSAVSATKIIINIDQPVTL